MRRAGLDTFSSFEPAQAADLLLSAVPGLGVTIVPRALAVTPAAQLRAGGQPYVASDSPARWPCTW
jgi:hypothetical protein